jgi:hypothetical protein
MATLYRKYDKKPAPADGVPFLKDGQEFLRWKDRRGMSRTAQRLPDGRMLVPRPCWYFDYDGPHGRVTGEKGYPEKDLTEKKARDLERDARREKVGLPVVAQSKALTPINEALDLYLRDLERQGRDAMYVYTQGKMIGRLISEIGWTTVGSVHQEGMTRWMGIARKSPKIRKGGIPVDQGPLSATSKNRYLETARAFLNFLVALDYLEGNTLRKIAKGSTTKKERERRALTDAEVSRLLTLAIPQDRTRFYKAALRTGNSNCR